MSYVVHVNSSQKRIIYYLLHFRLFHISRLLKTNLDDRTESILKHERDYVKEILENNSFTSLKKGLTFATVRKIKKEPRPSSATK